MLCYERMTDDWRNPAELPLDWMPLRRASEKVGRNDPCPCGSGKKYKKCCEPKDRAREASPYAGMTMEEALDDPGRHGDPRIIEKIPEERLAELKRESLASAQLVALMRRCAELKRWDEAELALAALEGRKDEVAERADDARAELVRSLLLARETPRAAAQIAKCGDAQDPLFAGAAVAVASLSEQQGALARLDQLLRTEIDHGPCMLEISDMLRSGGSPALALALLRATWFEQLQDTEVDLMNEDAEALRSELELTAQDPVVGAHLELLERLEEERGRPDLLEEKTQQNAELLAKLREARQVLRDLEAQRALAETRSEAGHGSEASADTADVRALKRKVEKLKGEIRAQQEERRELRQRLQSTAEEPVGQASDGSAERRPAAVAPEPVDPGESLPAQRPLRPVQFSDAFQKSLSGIESRLALKAQEQAVRFASYDAAMWRHAKKLADFEDLYSLRIGIHHRLLLRRSAEGGVEVRELVTRERHDALVARYRG
jgi:hypothetical protein